MIPAISIVGHSKSGKTTLMEALIRELGKRGRRVAAVKHAHEDFELDHPGKDSWRYAEAGCESIALLGARRSAVMRTHEEGYAFDEILAGLSAASDVILIEGLSSGPYPKIETRLTEPEGELRCDPEDLLAVVSGRPLEIGCKQFSLQEIGAIADVVEAELGKPHTRRTTLSINGKPLSIGSFTQKIIANATLGMVGSLKGVGKINTVSVLIEAADGISEGADEPL